MSHYTKGSNTVCPLCGKRCYLTRKDARRIARRIPQPPGKRLNAYPSCGELANDKGGEYWHLGHLPKPVVRGKIPRDDITKGQRRP